MYHSWYARSLGAQACRRAPAGVPERARGDQPATTRRTGQRQHPGVGCGGTSATARAVAGAPDEDNCVPSTPMTAAAATPTATATQAGCRRRSARLTTTVGRRRRLDVVSCGVRATASTLAQPGGWCLSELEHQFVGHQPEPGDVVRQVSHAGPRGPRCRRRARRGRTPQRDHAAHCPSPEAAGARARRDAGLHGAERQAEHR